MFTNCYTSTCIVQDSRSYGQTVSCSHYKNIRLLPIAQLPSLHSCSTSRTSHALAQLMMHYFSLLMARSSQ